MAYDDDEPATKGDVRELRGEMHGIRDELRSEMRDMRDDLRGEMHGIRDDLKEDIRAQGVKLESMDSSLRQLAESVTLIADGLRRERDERFAKLTLRLDRIEEVVRTCWRESRELRHDVDDLRREVTDLRRDIGELRTDAERRDATRLAPLEARVAELERRGGISKT